MYLATLLLSIQMVMAEPSTDQPMSPSEIYGLMDSGDWQTALLQAQRLADAQPSNALALLTLGDALAQYPNGSGDVFAAFDVWNQAKTVAVKGSRTQRFVQERLGWTLQHSALLKVVPMSSTGMRWWDSSFSYEMYLDKEIDLKGRTDYLKGAIYISRNLPSEEIILEVQPGKGLPTLIQTFTPKKGEMQTIFVPADMASLRVALEQGQFVTKETGGRAILDRYVQKQIADDDLMMSFTADSMPLPPFTFPQNTSIFLRNDEGNRVPYTIGVSDEVKGGRYVLEIHQEHHVTYADVVVHRDLVAQTIHDIVTDPAKQRATYESLESSSDEVAVVSNEAVSETVETTPQVPSTNSDSDNVDEPIVNTTEVDDKPVVAEPVEEIPVTENTEAQTETVSPVDVPVQEEQPTGVEEDGDGIEEQVIPETNTVEVSTETLAEPQLNQSHLLKCLQSLNQCLPNSTLDWL